MIFVILFFTMGIPLILCIIGLMTAHKYNGPITPTPYVEHTEHWLAHPLVQCNDYTYNYLHQLEPNDPGDHTIERDLYGHASEAVWK